MPLPGKLCVGILEEDNPQKSYFRFKPLLVEENGCYVPYAEPDAYPEDGCIRIVPDKNESSHFKARMRRMGLFAVVDLRDHPSDNDKIRVNKNFHGDDTERNAHIIYSDVVREPAVGTVFSLLSLSEDTAASIVLSEAPGACRVLLRPESSLLPSVWTCEADELEPDIYRLDRTEETVDADALQVFDIPGFRDAALSFAVLSPTKAAQIIEAPAPKVVKAPVEMPKEAPAEAPKAVETAAPEPAPEEKPWIVRDDSLSNSFIDHSLPPHQRILAAQCGINPRRGRSLQEIVDEKWRYSRIDQLGIPTASLSTGTPVQDPVELAVNVVRRVWSLGDQREALVNAFVQLEELENAMELRRSVVRESAVTEQLNELEAQRLQILDSIEQLKRNKLAVREELKLEIRQDEAAALADAVQKTEQAKAEHARCEAALAEIREAAACAEDALNALADGRFEERLNEFAITSHAANLLRRLDNKTVTPARVEGVDADAETIIARLRAAYAAAGMTLDRNDAINLLICAAQSPVLLISGAPGSGKSSCARLLAEALGACFEEYAPGRDAVAPALPERDVPAMALLDDANLAPSADMTRGLTPAAERGELLLCATLQDDGAPVPAYLFGRAFTLRLPEEAVGASWQPLQSAAADEQLPVTLAALKSAFAPQLTALPENVCRRLEKLRADLALLNVRLSRRTLTALWNYCAAAIPMMALEPSAVLDLALSQRAIPTILAGAPMDALAALPKLLEDLPRCKALLSEPLPVQY